MAELSLWLDDYNDIYSDFDSRHYSKRRISDDFLFELKRAYENEKQATELLLHLPGDKRQEKNEEIVSARLNEFFKDRHHFCNHQLRKQTAKGFSLFVTGIAVMLLNTWITHNREDSFLVSGLRVLLEPAGWFLVWTSFDFLYKERVEINTKRKMYKKLASQSIQFKTDK